MIFLGIESTCDETGVAIIDDKGNILSNNLYSQIEIHKAYGGVVPETAARKHLDLMIPLIDKSLKEACLKMSDIDVFCAATGPGLVGGLIIGTIAAKTMAAIYKKPFISVNHLQGHALLPTLVENVKFPFLLLLISGGHTQFLSVLGVNKYEILGTTIDDAIGEAFDKSARLLGLPYPGGKEIQTLAFSGNKIKYILPLPLSNQKNCDFSFAGLKTSVRTLVQNIKMKEDGLTQTVKQDIAASLQHTIAKLIINRTSNAVKIFNQSYEDCKNIVVSGGVSANLEIREELEKYSKSNNLKCYFPPLDLCTDNAIMIAWAGCLIYKERIKNKNTLSEYGDISSLVNPRWNLTDIK